MEAIRGFEREATEEERKKMTRPMTCSSNISELGWWLKLPLEYKLKPLSQSKNNNFFIIIGMVVARKCYPSSISKTIIPRFILENGTAVSREPPSHLF